MKVFHKDQRQFGWQRGIAVVLGVFLLSFYAVPATAQEEDGVKKVHYGLQLGMSENNIDLYHVQNGVAHELSEGNSSFYAAGFRLAVLADIELSRYFSLRVIPGMSLISNSWEPDGIGVATASSVDYKVKSVCGELPVDIKFHPFRTGSLRPFVATGLSYGLDFAALQDDSDNGSILRLNANDLRYTCGLGVDYDLHGLRLGIELKAAFGLLSPDTDNSDNTNDFYFHNTPTFSIGINIEG